MTTRRSIAVVVGGIVAAIGFASASCEDEQKSAASTVAATTSTGAPTSVASTVSSSSAGGGGAQVIVADCQNGWCRIPAGEFVIGSPESECGHPPSSETQAQVTITRSFLIGQLEVTQAEWESYGLVNPSVEFPQNPDDKGNCIAPDCPVGNINWFEAAAYSNLLSEAAGLPVCYVFEGCTGNMGEGMTCSNLTLSAATVYECAGYRLPTEAEWEFAARAGTTTPIYSGPVLGCELSTCYTDPNLEAIAWFCVTSGAQTQPVGQLTPNGWGLHDMIGNVLEWTHSLFDASGYGVGPLTDPGGEAGPVTRTTRRSLRGCYYLGWNALCRAAERTSLSVDTRSYPWGLRLARTLHD